MMLVGALQATRVALMTPRTGAWIADCELVLDDTGVVPSGRVTLTIGTQVLLGTIDPRSSGAFGPLGRVRIVAGGNGWDQIVDRAHEHNDAGVLSSFVIAKAAGVVGETAVVPVPVRLGVDFTRYAGRASQVLDDFDWYVDFQGVTQVSPRVPVILPDDAQVLAWDPIQQRADIAVTESLLVPGTVITDTRFGQVTIVDVEQTFSSDGGARVIAWCSDKPLSRLAAAMTAFVRATAGVDSLRQYVFRVTSQAGDGRLTLQAVAKADGVPDMIAISAWGPAGVSAKVAPGTLCLLEFGGDPGAPKVIAFDDTTPLEVDIEADAAINIKAPLVALGETAATGVATFESMTPLFALIDAFVTSVNLIVGTPNASGLASAVDPSGSLSTAVTTAATPLLAALVLPTNFSETVSAAP